MFCVCVCVCLCLWVCVCMLLVSVFVCAHVCAGLGPAAKCSAEFVELARACDHRNTNTFVLCGRIKHNTHTHKHTYTHTKWRIFPVRWPSDPHDRRRRRRRRTPRTSSLLSNVLCDRWTVRNTRAWHSADRTIASKINVRMCMCMYVQSGDAARLSSSLT